MANAAQCRIDGILATEANQAVIFRRGPSQLTQLLVWHLDTDRIEPGQWIRAHVRTDLSDVTPNGKYLIITASSYSAAAHQRIVDRGGEAEYNWTAISRPPYFTAIGLWSMGGAYAGGGIWKSNRELMVNEPAHGWEAKKKVPPLLRITKLKTQDFSAKRLEMKGWTVQGQSSEGPGLSWQNLLRNGKEALETGLGLGEMRSTGQTDAPSVMIKRFPNGFLGREKSWNREAWYLADDNGRVHRSWTVKNNHPQWIELDAKGRVVFAEAGCLWTWPSFPDGEPTLVADLNPNRFQNIAPTYRALQW